MYGYIYLTTNNVNNKKYIGQSSYKKINKKDYLGSGKYLKKAIQKYGKENFSQEILIEAETFEELNHLEKIYIAKYNAVQSKEFYNISPGGRASLGFTGKKHSIERNQKLSIRYKGHSVSDKVRQVVSEIGKITGKKLGNLLTTCPHCSKIGKFGPMHRWHFDNCKSKCSY